MVTPSAPTLGSVQLSFVYPLCRDSEITLLETEEKTELYDATDELLAGYGYLRGVTMDFCKGAVTLSFEPSNSPEYRRKMLLDIVATKFFKDNKEHIANLNPTLYHYMESNVLTKDIRKISDIFYRAFSRYLEEQTTNEYGLDNVVEKSTIARSKPGFKNFHAYCDYNNEQVTSFNILEEKAGEKFKKFLQTIPTSLLTQKDTKKAAMFLQEGLNQKSAYSDKLLYLRQVLFLLTFQDVFREGLYELKQSLNMERDNLYRSPNRSHDVSQDSQEIYRRIQLIEKTLSKFPINDVLTLIPLACRSSMEELSQDEFLEDCCLKPDSLARECGKARQADIAIRNLLENSFHVTAKSFAVKGEYDVDNTTGIESIESYLMGLSGLAISPGLMGRLAMHDHHTVYYQRNSIESIPPVSDDFLIEFLLTAAQFYPAINDNWIEESFIGYLIEMIGTISHYEVDGLKCKIQRVREAVHKVPVETLLKQMPGTSAKEQHYSLRNSAISKLQSLYKQIRKEVGLVPLSDKSSCCVM